MLLSISKKFFLKLLGLGNLFLIGFLLISLATFNDHDPTILNANNNLVTNLGGHLGANIISITLQPIGYAIYYPILFFGIIAFRLLNNHFPNYIIIRASIVLIVLPLLCGLLNFTAQYFNLNYMKWGGFIGDFIVIELTQVLSKRISLLILLIGSLIGVFISIGIKISEWQKICITLFNTIKYCINFLIIHSVRIFRKIIKITKIYNTVIITDSVDIKIDEAKVITPRKKQNLLEKLSNKPLIKLSNEPIKSTDNLSFPIQQDNGFTLPPINILHPVSVYNKSQLNKENLAASGDALYNVLKDFGINAELLEISPGPVVTLYEFEPAAGTKSARVIGLTDDIARSMKAVSARISVIPGKNAIGIELPNQRRETVYLKEILESKSYQESNFYLPLILGKNISGNPIIADLAKMPHLLVAGTTGSGKSVAINTMILSLLYKYTPNACKFVMIDPKMLELSVYDGIPHLLSSVVTDPKKAVVALKWVVKEMEERYRAMSTLGVRNISGYNKAIIEAVNAGKTLTKNVQTGFDRSTGKPIFERISIENKELPYIVVIVDEMADLMLVAGKDIESYIQRLAQMARAAGIHIIMATQRPSVDVITGVIKANFPTRISFQVTSKIDSRTILGEQGAEQLLGMGDMLYMMSGGRIERVHGPFVDDKEVENVVQFWKLQGEPSYIDNITEDTNEIDSIVTCERRDDDDHLYRQAVEIVMRDRKASTSYIQRCLRIGYNRAAIIIERMEKDGLVSSQNHIGKREILS